MHAHLVNAMWPAYNMNEGITAQYKLCQQHLTKHHVLQASQMPIPHLMMQVHLDKQNNLG
jgi:hypothetical protein